MLFMCFACHVKVHLSSACVGSILRVTTADQFASGKTSQFLGICIQRSGAGLGATFILRNTIEGQGRFHCISLIFWKVFSQDSILCCTSWDEASGPAVEPGAREWTGTGRWMDVHESLPQEVGFLCNLGTTDLPASGHFTRGHRGLYTVWGHSLLE